MRIMVGDGPGQGSEDQPRIACAGWPRTRSSGAQVGRDIQREASVPLDDGEQAPALRQALGAAFPGMVERQVPAAAEAQLLADIKVRGSAENVPLEEWDR